MDDASSFMKIMGNLQKNPRSKGYKCHSKLIRKLQENGIWSIMSRVKLTIEELRTFCETYDVANNTVRTWNKKLLEDPLWIPKHLRKPKIFSNSEENTLSELLRIIIDSHRIAVDNSIFRQICLDFYYQRHEPDVKFQVHFCDKWIRNFRIRHRFSRKKTQKKRKNEVSKEKIETFLKDMKNIFAKYPRSQIFNSDETFWRIAQGGDFTWTQIGSTDTSLIIEDEKKGFTVLCTIDATGRKYQPILIATGTSLVCERNWFGMGRNLLEPKIIKDDLPNPFYGRTSSRANSMPKITPFTLTDHSSSGWTTVPTWLRYLFHLRYNISPPNKHEDFYCDKNTIVLLCDSYPVHFCQEAMEYSKILNIKLVKIPEGATAQLQPLDFKVFGVLKNESRAFLNAKMQRDVSDLFEFTKEGDKTAIKLKETVGPSKPMTRMEAVVYLEKSWERITSELVLEAWNESIANKIADIKYSNEYKIVDINPTSLENLKQIHNNEISKHIKIYLDRQNERKKKKFEKLQQSINKYELNKRGKGAAQKALEQPSKIIKAAKERREKGKKIMEKLKKDSQPK